jgi:hypothetical protein
MDSTLIAGVSAVFGSVAGASASIATTWITQRNQTIREQSQAQHRRREKLYAEFIVEVSRLTADAYEHSLANPAVLVAVHAIAGRIRLVGTAAVTDAAQECCAYILDLYSRPNLTIDQLADALQARHPLRAFENACRVELSQYVIL